MNDEILDDLIINKEHYKIILAPFFETLKYVMEEENKLFSDVIIAQFEDTTKWILAKDIHIRFNINIDEAYILLEDMNVRSYLS